MKVFIFSICLLFLPLFASSSSVEVAVFKKRNDNDVSTISDTKILRCAAACHNMEGCAGFSSGEQDLCDFGEELRWVLREQVTPELGMQSSLNPTYCRLRIIFSRIIRKL